jgi:DNA (cytosine-5)-methyltransferase 1
VKVEYKMTLKILNLYAGIGGNRKLWDGDIEVTAVEIEPEIAKIYQDFFPNDKVIVGDAHQYLLEHFNEYDFIWTSPPCPSHSQFRQRCGVIAWGQKPLFPDMKLYEEIIFLQYYFKGKWIVENVESYYEPLIRPYHVSRHFFWSNVPINNKDGFQALAIKSSEVKDLERLHEFDLSHYKYKEKRKILRNCVEPKLGKYIFDSVFRSKQVTLC